MRRRTVLALAALLVQGAHAHAHLEQGQPAPDSKNAEVREIRLRYSEPVEAKLSSIRLEDREDRAVVEPEAQADPADGHVLVLHLYGPLAPGNYRLRWAAVAGDGHRVSGSYRFLVSH
jgi:methionine-rich copper-binding protein CopC